MSNSLPSDSPTHRDYRAELARAFETYREEVEGLRMYLLALPSEPSAVEACDIANRKAAIAGALATYNVLKARYAQLLFGTLSAAQSASTKE